MRGFHFDAEPGERPPGDYVIHVQCPWRIENDQRIVTGSPDWYFPASLEGVDLDKWDPGTGGSLQELRLREVFHDNDYVKRFLANRGSDLIVFEVLLTDRFGGCVIGLSGGYRIVIFPAGCEGEHWRLLRPTRRLRRPNQSFSHGQLVFEDGEVRLD